MPTATRDLLHFRSDPDVVVADPDGWAPLDDEWEYTAISLLDPTYTLSDGVTPICAQLTYAGLRTAAARLGGEMLPPDAIELLHKLAMQGLAIELPAYTGTPIAETSLQHRIVSDTANRASLRKMGWRPGVRVCNFGKWWVAGAPPGRAWLMGWWVPHLEAYTPPAGQPGHRAGPGFVQPRPAPGSHGAHGEHDQADDGTNSVIRRLRKRVVQVVDDVVRAAGEAA